MTIKDMDNSALSNPVEAIRHKILKIDQKMAVLCPWES